MIHIAYCFDRNYQQHFGASLTSLLLNSGVSGSDLCIHVITSEVDQAFTEKLNQIKRVYKARIDVHLSKPEETQSLVNLPVKTAKQNYLTQAAWTRILLAKILPADIPRVLYLDSDTIILADLRELFFTDMKGAPIAGVVDISNNEMCARLRLSNYINSGVLLMDLQQWRENDYVVRCLEHGLRTREENLYADQCAINTFFADNIHLLEKKWNRFVTVKESSHDSQEAAILHFITADKPWHAWYENGLSKYYWKYLDVSPWAGAKPELPQTVDKAQRLAQLLLIKKGGLVSILPRLISAFRSVGHEPLTGYNSYHFSNWMDAPFTKFVYRGELVGVAGLALQEIMFLEGLAGLIDPRSILVIGNAHGWSAVALALIFPRARVVALDPDEHGNVLTNKIAGLHGLNLIAVTGRSPEDVGRLFGDDFGTSLDFCLIDAVHENDHLKTDFLAIHPFLAQGGVVAIHDVINWNMMPAFRGILTEQGINGRLLTRTPSGMGIAWRDHIAEALLSYIDVFTEPAALYQSYQTIVRQHNLTKAEGAITAYR